MQATSALVGVAGRGRLTGNVVLGLDVATRAGRESDDQQAVEACLPVDPPRPGRPLTVARVGGRGA